MIHMYLLFITAQFLFLKDLTTLHACMSTLRHVLQGELLTINLTTVLSGVAFILPEIGHSLQTVCYV